MQQKEYPEALLRCSAAEKLDPGRPEVHYRLAGCIKRVGQPDARRKSWKVQQLHKKKKIESRTRCPARELPRTSEAKHWSGLQVG